MRTPSAARYWRDGFVAVPAVVPRETAAAWGATLERLEAAAIAHGEGRRAYAPWRDEIGPLADWVHELVARPALLDAVETLLGPDLLVRNVDLFVKDGWAPFRRTADRLTAHIDSPCTGVEADRMLTCWVALSDVDRRRGGLWYLRGSHRAELRRRPTRTDALSLDRTTRLSLAGRYARQDVALRSGGLSLHHSATVHGSYPNRSRSRRLALAIRFLAGDVSAEAARCGQAVVVRGRTRAIEPAARFPVSWWGAAPPGTRR